MPIYEYKCTKCNREFEITQKITDAPLSKCKHCGSTLKKLIANTSFVLKGSGWYVTDYPSSERKKAFEAKKTSEAKQESSGEVKDKKPDTTSADKKEKTNTKGRIGELRD